MSTTPNQLPHAWSPEALLSKSQRHAEQLSQFSHDDWQFVLWSSLALELLARAALAHISPVLLAATTKEDWHNLVYALQMEPNKPKFVPKSIDITECFRRLQDLLPDFDSDLSNFSSVHMARRNEELHAGSLPFDNLPSSSWLPAYYRASRVLLQSLGEPMEAYFGEETASAANEMIAASLDHSAKVVLRAISEHKTKWGILPGHDQHTLTGQATNWALRQTGHRVTCPACGNSALVTGESIGAPIKELDDEEIIEVQQFLPSRFECIACGLRIAGLAQLSAAGLGDAYKATFTYEAAEYYAPNDPYGGYDADYNE